MLLIAILVLQTFVIDIYRELDSSSQSNLNFAPTEPADEQNLDLTRRVNFLTVWKKLWKLIP